MLATIDSDIQNVNITEGENASFTCNFSKGDVASTVEWTVGGGQYDCDTAEEDIEADSNGCYTTETQSVLLIRDTSSFTPGRTSTVQCILQQNIPQEFRDDPSFNETFNNTIRTASLTITSMESESVTLDTLYNFLFSMYTECNVNSIPVTLGLPSDPLLCSRSLWVDLCLLSDAICSKCTVYTCVYKGSTYIILV